MSEEFGQYDKVVQGSVSQTLDPTVLGSNPQLPIWFSHPPIRLIIAFEQKSKGVADEQPVGGS